MFSENKRKDRFGSEVHKEQNKIAPGTKIVGDIEAKGCFRIEGKIEGTIKTPGKIVIGESGFINGTIECKNADIEGRISGNIMVTETLTLRSTALIEGEVSVGKLAIEPGATFNASCVMQEEGVKTLKDDRKGFKKGFKKEQEGAKRTVGA